MGTNQGFHVMKNQYPVILGLDFLVAHGAQINLDESQVIIDDHVFKLLAPPTRSILAKTMHPELVMAHSVQEVAVKLNKPIHSGMMYIEPIASFSRIAPDLEVTEGLIDKRIFKMRVVNNTDTPVYVPSDVPIGIARNMTVNRVTEFSDFFVPADEQTCDNNGEPDHNVECINPVCPEVNFNDVHSVGHADERGTAPGIDPNDDPDVEPQVTLTFDIENEKLSGDVKEDMSQFLHSNSKNFLQNMSDFGSKGQKPHKVKTGLFKSVSGRYYKTAPIIQRELDNQIGTLLRHGLITPSTSEWRSPVVMVKKADGSYRLTCDYRKLNSITETESFPLPRLEDVWDLVGESGATVFSTLDLASGFWQIQLDPETKHKTSFVTRNGQYQWEVLPFGLKNSPATFQAVMNEVLKDLLNTCVIVYVNDILCFSKDIETHKVHLQEIFDRLEKANLKLKHSKCKFAQSEVKFLGHILSETGVRPNPQKLDIIKNYPAPKNVKQVRQFLGLCNYYRRFQKDYAKIAKPLNNLTKKDAHWHWDGKCQSAFEQLRDGLLSAPILPYPDMNRKFTLTTDASDFAISYILSQHDKDGVERVIEFAGRALRGPELNYTVTDKEGLGIMEGFRHFHTYLFGQECTVVTDHMSLAYIKNHTKVKGRVARWAIELQNYTFTVVHRKGSSNTNADAISRLENLPQHETNYDYSAPHADMFSVTENDFVREEPLEYDLSDIFHGNSCTGESVMQTHPVDLAKEQQSCKDIGPIYEYAKTGDIPENPKFTKPFIKSLKRFKITDNILVHERVINGHRDGEPQSLVIQKVLPLSMRKAVLSEYHESLVGGGHQGFKRTYEAIRRKYFWPRMFSDIKRYIASCIRCQLASNHRGKRPPLNPIPVSPKFERWHVDFLGPLNPSQSGHKYILLFVDSFSRWCEAFPVKSADAATTASVLYSEIICRYGAPAKLVSDRGTHFVNSLIQSLCDIFGVKRQLSSPYHPCSNAVCERFNSFLNKSLRSYVNDTQSDWPGLIPGILMAYRLTPAMRSTEFSPFFLLFNQEMQTPLDTTLPRVLPDVATQFKPNIRDIIDSARKFHEVATQNIKQHQEENKTYHDTHAREPDFEVNDLVWLHDPRVPVGLSKKLRRQWTGPYKITAEGPGNTYQLRHALTDTDIPALINAARLKHAVLDDLDSIRLQYRQRQARTAPDRAPLGQPPETEGHNADDSKASAAPPEEPDVPEQEPTLPAVEKVVDLSTNNKGKWCRVKFQGSPKTEWRLYGSIPIPEQLINDRLRTHTWQGKRRKRKRRRH